VLRLSGGVKYVAVILGGRRGGVGTRKKKKRTPRVKKTFGGNRSEARLGFGHKKSGNAIWCLKREITGKLGYKQ